MAPPNAVGKRTHARQIGTGHRRIQRYRPGDRGALGRARRVLVVAGPPRRAPRTGRRRDHPPGRAGGRLSRRPLRRRRDRARGDRNPRPARGPRYCRPRCRLGALAVPGRDPARRGPADDRAAPSCRLLRHPLPSAGDDRTGQRPDLLRHLAGFTAGVGECLRLHRRAPRALRLHRGAARRNGGHGHRRDAGHPGRVVEQLLGAQSRRACRACRPGWRRN
jgi:hypothetical protein